MDHQSRNEVKRIRTQRMEARKQELSVDWVMGGGELCYRAAREQGELPTLVLSRQDGTLTADPGQIHALVEKVWVKGCSTRKTARNRGRIGKLSWRSTEGRLGEEGGHAGGLENL